MIGRWMIRAGGFVALLGWLVVAYSIRAGDLAQVSGLLQFYWTAAIAFLTVGTGGVALALNEVAKLDHELPADDDHDVTTGGRRVR